MSPNRTTTPLRVAAALVAGAALAGLLTGTAFAVLQYASGPAATSSLPTAVPAIALMALGAAVAAAVVFLLGLLLLAAPLWFLAHRRGWRSIRQAMILGAVLTGVVYVGLLLLTGSLDLSDLEGVSPQERARIGRQAWAVGAAITAGLALIGATAGALIWRIAYGADAMTRRGRQADAVS